jgi:hypothetical protein
MASEHKAAELDHLDVGQGRYLWSIARCPLTPALSPKGAREYTKILSVQHPLPEGVPEGIKGQG